MSKLICLESVDDVTQRFYSICSDEKELAMSVGDIINYPSGVSYRILGFIDDINNNEAAVRILYPSKADEQIALANYIYQISTKLFNSQYEIS